jgi:hypothetical protein
MKLKGKSLAEWLAKNRKHASLPGHDAVDYYQRYHGIAEYLNTHVHPFVNISANAVDGGTLTDHGPEHIKTVIARASQLVSSKCELSAYEVYLLLVAIHVHDVGNLFGRESHELNSEEVIHQLGLLMGEDRVERKAIYDIAQAHGGNIAGDKDKISHLPRSEPLLGSQVREQLLAAILRFADELADDRTRASGFLLKVAKVHPTSEIYHRYAQALHSVIVDLAGGTIDLHFDMSLADASTTFGKGTGRLYLLDEIYERTMKMHCERRYCMRFLRPDISIDRIDIEIKVYGDKYNSELARIPYRLEESGYPDASPGGVLQVCQNTLAGLPYGTPLTGKALCDYLKKGASDDHH